MRAAAALRRVARRQVAPRHQAVHAVYPVENPRFDRHGLQLLCVTSVSIADHQRRQRPGCAQVAHARRGRQAITLPGVRESGPRPAAARRRPRRAASTRAATESISSATRDTSPIITMARRSVSSRSARQRSNGPSKVQTSGAGQRVAARLAGRPAGRGAFNAFTVRLPCSRPSWRPGDLQGDFGRRIRAVVAGSVDLARAPRPVAFGQHGDDLGPGPAACSVGAVGGHVPLVGPQRTAGARLGAAARRHRRAQVRQFVERQAVVREAGGAGLAGEPADLATAARIEDLFAGRARGADAVAVRRGR